MKMKKRGFTLVEIMIVVAIIGLLAAIAIPSFMRARQTSQTNTCMNNLRLLSGAIQQWALEENKTAADAVVTVGGIDAYMKNTELPVCPLSDVYDYVTTTVDEDPTCANFNVDTHNATLD